MKQLGIALHNYHDTTGSFPTSIWRTQDSSAWPGARPVRGQFHSWCAMILPYMEQTPVYNANNFSLTVAGGIPNSSIDQNLGLQVNHTALMTPIATFMCPSDPSPTFSTYIRVDSGVGWNFANNTPMNSGPKLSYFGNFGDNHPDDPTYWPWPNLPIGAISVSAS